MDFTATADLLAQASRFGDDLKQLEGLLHPPRADLAQHLATLQASFAALLTEIASELAARDDLLSRIDEAARDIRKLSQQVKAMDTEIRTLQARVEFRDGHADPFAGRH